MGATVSGRPAGLDGGLEVIGHCALGGQHPGVVAAQPVLALEALPLRAGQLGQVGAHPLHPLAINLQRGQVRLGEVAIVVGLLLAPLADRGPPGLVPAHRLLHYLPPGAQHFDLSLDLVLDRAGQRAKAVDVLDLGARAHLSAANRAHRDVGLEADHALFHISGIHPQIAQDGTQAGGAGPHIFHRAQVRLGDDLQQRHPGPVKVHQRMPFALLVHVEQLAGVLFQMHAADTDALLARFGLDGQPAIAGQRQLVLGNLVAFGQVGVKVVLAGEDVQRGDFALQRQRHPQGILHRTFVDYRQRAGHPGTDRADEAVGFGGSAVHHGAAAEHLGLGQQFGVDFQADDGFIVHRLFQSFAAVPFRAGLRVPRDAASLWGVRRSAWPG